MTTKPQSDHDIRIVATNRVTESLSGWTNAPTAQLTDNRRSRSEAGARRLTPRDSLVSAAAALPPWRGSREKPFEFSHYADTRLYMEQYRADHRVDRQRSAAAVAAAARFSAQRNVTNLQLQFSCRCSSRIGGGVCSVHASESKAHVGPFTNDSSPPSCGGGGGGGGGGALKPHLKPKSSTSGVVPCSSVNPTAKAKMEREALMSSRRAGVSNENGKEEECDDVSYMCISGLGTAKRKGLSSTGMGHFKRRVARAKSLRYHNSASGDDAGAESVVGKSDNSQGSSAAPKQFPQEFSIDLKSSNEFKSRLKFEDTRVGMSCMSPSPQKLVYRLSRPPLVNKTTTSIEEIARHAALVTPLVPLSKSLHKNANHLKHSLSASSLGDKTRKLGVVDCRKTPDVVEGIRKELSLIRRTSVPLRLPSRGGGWRGSRSSTPCQRSAMRTPVVVDPSNLSVILDVQGTKA